MWCGSYRKRTHTHLTKCLEPNVFSLVSEGLGSLSFAVPHTTRLDPGALRANVGSVDWVGFSESFLVISV